MHHESSTSGRTRQSKGKDKELQEVIQVFLKFFSIEVLAGLIILIASYMFVFFYSGETKLADYYLRLRAINPHLPISKEIFIVEIDDPTIKRLKNDWQLTSVSPLPRAFMAQLVDNLEKYKPKVLALDIYFDMKKDKHGDSLLANKIQEYNNIVVVSRITSEGAGQFSESPPLEEFVPQGDLVGFSEFLGNKNKIYKYLPVIDLTDGTLGISFPLLVYLRSRGIKDKVQAYKLLKNPQKLEKSFGLSENNMHKYQYVNYVSPPIPKTTGFKHISAARLTLDYANLSDKGKKFRDRFYRSRFENKIVLVGAAYSGAEDRYNSPVSPKLFKNMQGTEGIWIHANILNSYLKKFFLYPPDFLSNFVFVLISLLFIYLFFHIFGYVKGIIFTSIYLLLLWVSGFVLFIYLKNVWIPVVYPSIFAVIYSMYLIFSGAVKIEKEQDHIERVWGPYVPLQRLNKLKNIIEFGNSPTATIGRKELITILFLKFVGIEKLFEIEEEAVKKVLAGINRVIESIEDDIIFLERNQGATDRFLGDGLLIYFGIPVGEENSSEAKRAIRTAEYIRQNFNFIANKYIPEDFSKEFGFAMVIHSGEVVVGEIENKFGDKEPTIVGTSIEQARMLAHLVASEGRTESIWISETTLSVLSENSNLKVEVEEPLDLSLNKEIYGTNKLYLEKKFAEDLN